MRVCIPSEASGLGGPKSFQRRLTAQLVSRGIDVVTCPRDRPYDAILLINGSKRLDILFGAKLAGIRIVQRLGSPNWIQLRGAGFRKSLVAKSRNGLVGFIRRALADHLVYQSDFAFESWQAHSAVQNLSSTIIRNGVDLSRYSPDYRIGTINPSFRILVVEANIADGYEVGTLAAIEVCDRLRKKLGRDVAVDVAGRAPGALLRRVRQDWVTFHGIVDEERIIELYRSSDCLFSTDLYPACPNSVIEAMACGLPILGLRTGALPELVPQGCGICCARERSGARITEGELDSLVEAAGYIYEKRDAMGRAARDHAIERFGASTMADAYLRVLTAEL